MNVPIEMLILIHHSTISKLFPGHILYSDIRGEYMFDINNMNQVTFNHGYPIYKELYGTL